ncbi:MAG TPA: FAD-binding oxidoreductase, partial [Desulfobacterales bacterium]|nr:FAD-binding oxidoreductase [Desulfobacterales bacterium]
MIVYTPITLALKEKIIDQIGGDCVVSDPKTIEEYSHDASELTHEPELILEVQSARQVSLILEMANRYRFPVTPRGGGTGLAGGGVLLSLAGMNRIKSIDT